MNSGKISVIVPVFNTGEDLLRRSIGSVLAQSYGDWELLLIDDGSTDGSADICREYASSDPRISLFRKTNGGVSSARNAGLDHATGDFVLFMDSDDSLPENALSSLISGFSESVDLSMGGYTKIYEDGTSVTIRNDRSSVITRDECMYMSTPYGLQDWQRYLWNRLLRRDVILDKGIRFREDLHYKEDGLFLTEYVCRMKGDVFYSEDIVYHYYLRPGSAMGKLAEGFDGRFLTNIRGNGLIVKEVGRSDLKREILNRLKQNMITSFRWMLSTMKKTLGPAPRDYLYIYGELLSAVGVGYYLRFRLREILRNNF